MDEEMAAKRNYFPKVLNIETQSSLIPKLVLLNSMPYTTKQTRTETKLTATYHVHIAKKVKSEVMFYF